MSKHTFPISELVPRGTPKLYEGEVAENDDLDTTKPINELPRVPEVEDFVEERQGLEVIVTGPSYGKVTVKVEEDGSNIDRVQFRVIEEDRNEVASETEASTIPTYVHTALLKAGWFCTDWGQDYTVTGADYLATFAAACYHLSESSEYSTEEEEVESGSHEFASLFMGGGHDPERIAGEIHETVESIHHSALLNHNRCNELLQEELETRISSAEEIGVVEAITNVVEDWESLEDFGNQEIEKQVVGSNGDGQGNIEEPFDIMFRGLRSQGNVWDTPNVCVSYLPEYRPESPGPEYWRDGLVADGLFHLPYSELDNRYTINTETFEEDGEEFLQVGVSTFNFTFYEKFKQVQEGEYITASSDGLPAIFCAAVVREMGGEIENLPTPSELTLVELYRAVSEMAVKVYKKNQGLHEQTIERLDYLCTTIKVDVSQGNMETETVDQEKLPGATGDGVRGTLDIDSGVAGEFPDGVQ